MDQRRQASRKDNSPFLSSVPLEPSAAGAELAGLQPGEFVTVAGVTQANRELVADQLAAAAGEDRWTAGQTCALLLATAGGRTSDAAAVRGDAGPDRAATATDGIASWWARQPRRIWLQRGWNKETCCKSRPQMGHSWAVLVWMADRQECSR